MKSLGEAQPQRYVHKPQGLLGRITFRISVGLLLGQSKFSATGAQPDLQALCLCSPSLETGSVGWRFGSQEEARVSEVSSG